MTLIGQGKERTRLQQLIDWCGGPDWDGPLIFDEASPLSPALSRVSTSRGCAVQPRRVALPWLPLLDSCASLDSSKRKGTSLLLLCGQCWTCTAATAKCWN